MTQPLGAFLQAVRVTGVQEAAGLQVFGLGWDCDGGLTYTTLDEGLAAGTIQITEISQAGSVPTLRVINRGNVRAFLMAGEHLVGAKQDRVLNASLMVPGRGELLIPVSCVEAGRWRSRSPKFSSSGGLSHSKLRKLMSLHASEGYHREGRPSSRQGEVWDEVARKLGRMGSVSTTQAFHQVYKDYQDRLTGILGRLTLPQGCCGAAFALGGRIAGADLFDQPATLAKLWPKLVRAYALDALETGGAPAPPIPVEAIRRWFDAAAGAKAEPFKSPGMGDDIRLTGADLVGAGLVVEDRPVHVDLFALGRSGPVESRTPRSDRKRRHPVCARAHASEFAGPQVSPPLRFRPVPCASGSKPDPEAASFTESCVIGNDAGSTADAVLSPRRTLAAARKRLIRDIIGFIGDLIERSFHPGRRQLAAYHEAGHAVAAVALGIGFKYVSIVPGPYTFGRMVIGQEWPHRRPRFDPRNPEHRRIAQDWIVLALAGECAEAYRVGREDDFRRLGAKGDYGKAAELAEWLCADAGERAAVREEMQQRARCFVRDSLRWRQITAVATRLVQVLKLDGRQVGQIMDEIAAAGEPGGPE